MWPLSGVLAAILIVLGIALLIAYAVRRGLMRNDLPDTIASAQVPITTDPAPATQPASRSRTLGALGAVILVVGLALGVFTAVAGGWGSTGSGTGADGGCAQSWNGCPQVTAPARSNPPLPTVAP